MTTNSEIINSCKEEPSQIFIYIKEGKYSEVEEIINNNIVNINTVDNIGNDVMMRLLKAKQYDIVINLMKKKNWNVNHQNVEGNTFSHLIAMDDSVMAVKVIEKLTDKSNYLPNIKNNNNQTSLDLALQNKNSHLAVKLLGDRRFTNINLFSFKNLFDLLVRNKLYGKYSKITNLEIIVDSLDKKSLDGDLVEVINYIKDNMDVIKQSILNDRFKILDNIVETI